MLAMLFYSPMISTSEYIQQFSTPVPKISFIEKMAQWIHDHPLLVKITRLALCILGAVALGCSFAFGNVFLGAFGITAIAATEVLFRKLDSFGVLSSSMSYHAFKPAKCEGGRLFYQGDVPILSIESDNPYKAGKAHGYLTAPQALQLARRTRQMAGLPDPSHLDLTQIKQQIPEEYLTEMKGMVDGINLWIDQQWFWSRHPKTTFDEILLGQLMPDGAYYIPKKKGNQAHPIASSAPANSAIACSVIIEKNRNSGLVFGRNMDWTSFGLVGIYSLVINRKYKNGKNSTVEVGIPGFVGTLTGMNQHGLSVAMNVCLEGYYQPEGIPAAFYNRMVLENNQSVRQGCSFISDHDPLGSYHLSLADSEEAQSVHLYQGFPKRHITRKLEKGKPLITTNCSYITSNKTYLHTQYSQEREAILHHFFEGAKERIRSEEKDLEALIAHSQTLSPVNNVHTTHAVEMIPGKKRMLVAFDNSFAASQPMHEIDTKGLL